MLGRYVNFHNTLNRRGTLKSPTTICLVSSKITIVGDSRFCVMQGFEIEV